MNDLSPSLTQRRYELDAWNAHCSSIIRSELARRDISARALFNARVIKSRNGFAERLKADMLRPREMADLMSYLQLDLAHLMTAFLASEPDLSYTNTVYENISRIYRALVSQYEKLAMDLLPDMDPLRPAVANTVASRVLDLLTAHHQRCEQARDVLSPL